MTMKRMILFLMLSLLLLTGPYGSNQIILVEVASGEVQPLAQGISPVWQP